MGLIAQGDLWETIRDNNVDELIRERPLDLEQDPLALSWASYHVYQKNPDRRWADLTHLQASPHDIEMAEVTRKHYRDRVGIRMLQTSDLSEFQRELYAVCIGHQPLKHRHLGMIYKLPYFYVEDLQRAKLSDLFDKRVTRAHATVNLEKAVMTLTPVIDILKSRRGGEIREYWWKNQEDLPVCIEVQESNSLRGLIDSLHDQSQPVRLRAYWRAVKRRDGLAHFQPTRLEFV